jgi:tetratricopeptide (TPR) repeat protein
MPEAFPHWKKSLRSKPDFAEAHSNFAVARAQAGRFDEAIGHYEEVLRLQQDDADARRGWRLQEAPLYTAASHPVR